MYLGKITAWNDPAIAKLNPGVNLPSTKVTPVYRSDGSGDTFAWTNYLSSVSPEFKSTVGVSTQVKFPTGVGAEKSDGVAAAVSQTDGAIGYLGLAYIASNDLSYGLVQNAAGKFPNPDVASIKAAAAAVGKISSDNSISIDQSAGFGDGRVPDLHLHVRDRSAEDGQGRRAEEVHHLRDRSGAGFRPGPQFRAAAVTGRGGIKKAIAKIGS